MDDTMNKRPSFQFYPADWLKDPDLQICTMSTIGIWINILCRMWESKKEGVLSGTIEELAMLAGAQKGEFNQFLKDAKFHNFCDVLHDVTNCDSNVTLKCRRMNKLFREREGGKSRMRKHRSPDVTPDVTTPSSSSSSTTTTNKEYRSIFNEARKLFGGTKRGNDTEFNNFVRKYNKWEELLPILKPAIENQICWRENANGEFRPPWKNFQTWINNRCWEEEVSTAKGAKADINEGKTKLWPIRDRVCGKRGCGMPAVYKSVGDFDHYYCGEHMPAKVKEKFYV